MDINIRPLARRDFLRGSLAAAALAATGSLTACATSGTSGSTSSSSAPAGQVSDTNPFGVESGSTLTPSSSTAATASTTRSSPGRRSRQRSRV